MCVIFGFIGENLILRKVGVIEKMVSSIHHRGPNSNVCWENDKCRLSA